MILAIAAGLVLSGPTPAVAIKKVRTSEGLHIISCAASPIGSRIAVCGEDRNVRVIDAASGTTIYTLTGHPDSVYGLAFNPTGTVLATGDEKARVWLWDMKTGKKIKELDRTKGHQRGIQALSFSADGTRIVSTGKDDFIILWDVKTGKVASKVAGAGANFYSSEFSPAGGVLLAPTLGNGLRFYKPDGTIITSVDGHAGQGALSLGINKAGTIAVTGGKDQTAAIWDLKTRKKAGTLRGHEDWVIGVAVSPNGKLAATSSSDRTVIVHDLSNGQQVAKFEDQCAVGAPLAFTGDGKYLIAASVNDALEVFSVTPPQAGTQTVTKKVTKKRKK